MTGRWRRSLPAVVLVGAALLAVGLLATGALRGTLTYYRTPTELAGAPDAGTVRVGGLVVAGSVHRGASAVSFLLSDGSSDLPVRADSVPPSTFRAGQGAVVEGRLGPDGVFRAHTVMVRHSNEYRPPDGSGS